MTKVLLTGFAPFGKATLIPSGGIVKAINDAGVPADVSLSAGAFLCNHVFYASQVKPRVPFTLGAFLLWRHILLSVLFNISLVELVVVNQASLTVESLNRPTTPYRNLL
jgi:hypothetical protein